MTKKPFQKFKAVSHKKVSRLRRTKGENQSDFWNRIGITQSGGSRYEAGRNIPISTQILIDLAYGETPLETLSALRNKPIEEIIKSV